MSALDNLDKHQIVHAGVVATKGHLPKDDPRASRIPPGSEVIIRSGQALSKGAEIFRVYSPPGYSPQPHVAVDNTFGFGESLTSLAELDQIRADVVGIVESFALDFP
ncbi:MAG: hypothetical protein ACR2G9_06655 [Gaiellaceae bacterium]